MAYIKLPEFDEMEEDVRESLKALEKKTGEVGEISRMLALRPDIFRATTVIFKTLMVNKTELDKYIKETLAILISEENGCKICVGEHERIARMLGMPEEHVNAVIEGLEKMQVPEKERILYQFCLRCASKENYKILQSDIDELRAAGYTDSQILEAVAIVGYFNYINTISNSLGAGK
ncbi:MAG: peroxidase-related enzyme [Deltaproteobacteria bacterium]|nr:peroxidase-related enzyme [Deltaproteobacteria bacterium]